MLVSALTSVGALVARLMAEGRTGTFLNGQLGLIEAEGGNQRFRSILRVEED